MSESNLVKMLVISFFTIISSGCGEFDKKPEKNHSATQSKGSFRQPFQSMLVYPKKNRLPGFSLTDHQQQPFNQQSFQGKWNLVFLGYTNCPDVCPTMLTDLTQIYKKIDAKLKEKFQIIFLSVDPQRDHPAHLAKYIDFFDNDFIAITGDKPDLDTLVAGLGGIYSLNLEEGEYYSVDHSSRIFIIDPHAQRYGIITSEALHNKDRSLLIEELELMAQTEI